MPITVSDAAAEESLQAYTNPLSIQAKALDDLSEKVLNGAVVSDGNNPFTFLTEFASNMTATLVNKACDCFNGLYPINAQTATELYRHLSDFDTIGLFATPATTMVELVFDRNFLIDHALDVNAEEGFNEDPEKQSGFYSKIVLPAYSKFMIGDYTFGLMYPIEIKVRKAIKDNQIDYANSTITVTWDASKENPLMPLTSHILEHRDFIQDGQMLTAIAIPIYQFEVDNHLENSIGATGFAKRYNFMNRFYAIRVFHFKNGEWNEMAQTFSDTKYDPEIPTAIIKVLTDLGKVEVVIPHIYFNSTDSTTIIGQRILVKVYTTRGEINVDLTEYKTDQFQASFLLTDANLVEDDRYSNMLKRIPTVYVLPINLRISSGTNGLSFAQLMDRVKYNSAFTVKITPSDLQNYFNTSGYKFTKELDNITDRVYCAHKLLKDGTGSPIASGQGYTYLRSEALDIQEDGSGKLYVPGYSTLTVRDSNTITINPDSIYKYNEEEDRFYLLSDAEIENIQKLPLQDRINELNDNLYSYSPFHTVLSYANHAPIAGTYDMFKPQIKDRIFLWENDKTTVEISIYNATIEVNPNGGYLLRISIFKTANIADVPVRDTTESSVDNYKLMLSTTGRGSETLYLIGKYEGIDTTGKDVFLFVIESDFRINADSELYLTNFRNGMEYTDSPNGGYVNMGFHTYIVSLCMLTSEVEKYSEVGQFNKSNTVVFNLPSELDEYALLCRQSFEMKLGEALPLLRNNVTISTTDETYATYTTTQFATYQAPIYARWTIQDAIDGLCPEDAVGKLKLDKQNHLIIKHDAGDVILSSQYDICYGPSVTLTITKTVGTTTEVMTDTLELIHNDTVKIPSTSKPSNAFSSIDGDVFIQSRQYPELGGIYKIVDRTATGTDRVWKHQFNKLGEIFDTSILLLNQTEPNPYDPNPYDLLENPRFVSSNNIQVKELLANIISQDDVELLRDINTEATGYDRKWFMLDEDNNGFDFVNYTGYVIEYNCSGSSPFGTSMCWVLNYYYLTVDEEGDPAIDCITLAENLNEPGTEEDPNPLPQEYWIILNQDPYVKGYIATYHEIRYVWIDNKCFIVLAEENQLPLYRANCILELGPYQVVLSYEPWDVIWHATEENVIDTPIVDRISSSEQSHRIRTVDALQFISEHMVDSSPLDLYRDRETLEDPNAGIMFVSVSNCDDTQSPPEANYIGYISEEADDVSGEGGHIELGTRTAPGAIYYRDLAMTNYDYTEEDGLDETDVLKIINMWYKQHVNGYPDNLIYDNIIAEYSTGKDKIGVPLTPYLLSKIVSSSAPCYYSPWRKLITSSSSVAIASYLAYRESLTPYDNPYEESASKGLDYAGYISVIEDADTDEILYINLLSKFTRTIGEGDDAYEETEFYVNPDNLTWNEIDHWVWEYTTPWIDYGELKEVDNISITYNSALSSTQILYGLDTVKLDDDGLPIVASPRALTYAVEMIHCDYKLSLSEDAEYSNYMEDVRELLRAYFSELNSITPSLLARTKLYFSPIRTFGHAEFKGSNGSIQMLPVQFTAELGLHIEAYVKDSTASKKTIRDVILTLIDKDMKDGTINLSLLAKEITKELSDNVLYVDVLGLNGNKTQQTMIPVNEDTYPQLKQILVMYEDRTIHVDRALELDWYVIA